MHELDPLFDTVARYFSLLAEPTRLRILHCICHEEKSVNEIVMLSEATQTNVSRHLNLLHRAGIVARRKEGNQVYYQVADPVFINICREVCVRIAARIEEHQPLRNSFLELMPNSQRRKKEFSRA